MQEIGLEMSSLNPDPFHAIFSLDSIAKNRPSKKALLLKK